MTSSALLQAFLGACSTLELPLADALTVGWPIPLQDCPLGQPDTVQWRQHLGLSLPVGVEAFGHNLNR